MKRYGVHRNPGDPDYWPVRRDHETWEQAREEYDALGKDDDLDWRIWDYTTDPPSDVTDEPPANEKQP